MPVRVKVGDQLIEVPDGMNEQNMALWIESHMPMKSPTTFSEGFHEGLKNEPVAGGAVGFAEGLPQGLKAGAIGLAQTPLWLLKEAASTVQGAANLTKDPEGTIRGVIDKYKNLPADIKQGLEHYAQLAATDPEAWGRTVGELTGETGVGIAASRLAPLGAKPAARQIGTAVEGIAKHGKWPIRMIGAHQLGAGNPMGLATMMIPEGLEKAGAKLSEFGGAERTGARLPSSTRDIEVDVAGLKPIRVQPPAGPATPRVPITGMPAEASGRVQKVMAAEQVAADNATRLQKIQDAQAGMKAGEPSISETLSAKTPEGGRTSMSTKFVADEEASGGGSPFKNLSKEEVDSMRRQNYSDADLQKIDDQLGRTPQQVAPKVATPPAPPPPAGAVRMTRPVSAGDVNSSMSLTYGQDLAMNPRMGIPSEVPQAAVDNPEWFKTKFDKVMEGTHVPDDLTFEGTEGINPPPPSAGAPMSMSRPSMAVPDEWLDAVAQATKRTGSKTKSFVTQGLSPNDVSEAVTMYRENPNLAPADVAAKLEELRASRRGMYRDLGSLSATERQMLQREQE